MVYVIFPLVFPCLCDISIDTEPYNVISGQGREEMTLGAHLTGNYRVRAIRPAIEDSWRFCNTMAENTEVRRHALKLRYWPERNPEADSGQIVDLDWSWVRSLRGMKVGELRVNDTIGGNDNLRIIFFVGDPAFREPLPMIWVLRVMHKRRDQFTKNDLAIFRARRALVRERFYGGP